VSHSQDKVIIPIGNTTSLAWSCAPGGAADFLSNMWLDYTGSTFGEQLGRGWMRAIHAEDIERLISTCDRIFQSGCAGNESARIKGADGAYRWFQFSAVPSKDGTGRVSKLYVTCVEIHDPTVECLMAAERSFLRVIAEGAAIDAALSDICSFLDKSGPDFCSIVLIDDEAKRLWTAPFGALSGAHKNEIAPIRVADPLCSCLISKQILYGRLSGFSLCSTDYAQLGPSHSNQKKENFVELCVST